MPKPTRVVDKGKTSQTNSQSKSETIRKVLEPPKVTSSKGNIKSMSSTTQNGPSSSRPIGQPANGQPKKNNHSRGKPNNNSKGNHSGRRSSRSSNSKPKRFNKLQRFTRRPMRGAGSLYSSDEDWLVVHEPMPKTQFERVLLRQVESTRVTHILREGNRCAIFLRIWAILAPWGSWGQLGSRNLRMSSRPLSLDRMRKVCRLVSDLRRASNEQTMRRQRWTQVAQSSDSGEAEKQSTLDSKLRRRALKSEETEE
nr:uncharacterized protein LOC109188716 [Ipomoea batatas]